MKENWPLLEPGAWELHKFQSGNAGLERVFSLAGRAASSKLRKQQDLRRLMLLHYNGLSLKMPDYRSLENDVTAVPDEMAEPACTVEFI